MRRELQIALAVIAALAVACAPRSRLTPDLKADPARLLEAVQDEQARIESVQGGAWVKIASPDVNGTATAYLAAERPGKIRVELLDFFGNPVSVLVANGPRFAYFDARRGTWYRGDATPENISRFLPISLPPWELSTILRGAAPILEGVPTEVVERGGGVVALVIQGAGLVQTLGIGEDLRVVSSHVRAAGDAAGPSPHYDLTFRQLMQQEAGRLFPMVARLDAPRARAQVQVDWKSDVEVNGNPRSQLFALDPPAGAEVVDLPPGAVIPEVEIPLGTEN